jgi:FdrA protein
LTKVGAHVAFTLEDAAKLSVQVLEGRDKPSVPVDPNSLPREKTDAYGLKPQQTKVVGLFAGGTHSAETTMVLKKMQADHKEFASLQMDVIDLGDDEYCVGKPHPMIDGTTRKSVFIKRASDPDTAVIIFDVVLGKSPCFCFCLFFSFVPFVVSVCSRLGFGSHDNPAADICEAIATCRQNNPNVVFVGHVCGVSGTLAMAKLLFFLL